MDNTLAPVTVETVIPTTSPAVEPKTRAKKAVSKKADKSGVPSTIAGVYAMAKGITLANIAEKLAVINAGFVVNAPGKNVGRFTGRRIVAFQNDTLLENGERGLTDVQLLFVWRAEFPSATGKVFANPDIRASVRVVGGVRAELNRDGHGEAHRVPSGFKSVAVTGKK